VAPHDVEGGAFALAAAYPAFPARTVFVAGVDPGVGLAKVGPPVEDALRLPRPPVRALGKDEWEGTIVHVDRFGNLTSNVSARALDDILSASDADRSDVVVVVAGVVAPLVLTYADVPTGEPCALVGSSGRLELAVNGGSAASIPGAGRGAPVRIRRVYQPAI